MGHVTLEGAGQGEPAVRPDGIDSIDADLVQVGFHVQATGCAAALKGDPALEGPIGQARINFACLVFPSRVVRTGDTRASSIRTSRAFSPLMSTPVILSPGGMAGRIVSAAMVSDGSMAARRASMYAFTASVGKQQI
jgi:hypothetical protein